mmetsp:Transcript_35670/g.57377  ORF Transcript_35670/g.57377 Transcript_35670/m.57377 type:complete len:84 (+) Transcript_35670:749-1000(+)
MDGLGSPPHVIQLLRVIRPSTRSMRGHWVLAVWIPLPQLEALCDPRPVANPVKFVPRMKHACERLGLDTEVQSGGVCLSLHAR